MWRSFLNWVEAMRERRRETLHAIVKACEQKPRTSREFPFLLLKAGCGNFSVGQCIAMLDYLVERGDLTFEWHDDEFGEYRVFLVAVRPKTWEQYLALEEKA